MRKLHIFIISLFITIPCIADDCFPQEHPDYQEWVIVGKPACWCYLKQCYGDTNGASFFGKPVTLSDLNLFKAAFNQSELPEGGICADLDHSSFFGKRVTLGDLNIFKQYFDLPESQVPDCFDIIIPH